MGGGEGTEGGGTAAGAEVGAATGIGLAGRGAAGGAGGGTGAASPSTSRTEPAALTNRLVLQALQGIFASPDATADELTNTGFLQLRQVTSMATRWGPKGNSLGMIAL